MPLSASPSSVRLLQTLYKTLGDHPYNRQPVGLWRVETGKRCYKRYGGPTSSAKNISGSICNVVAGLRRFTGVFVGVPARAARRLGAVIADCDRVVDCSTKAAVLAEVLAAGSIGLLTMRCRTVNMLLPLYQ